MRFRNTWLTSVLVVTAAFLAGDTAVAQESLRRITLDEALVLFAEHNLELQIARADAAEAAGFARQARAYPNPVAAFERESVSDGMAGSETETYFTVTQQLDWPWRYARRRAATGKSADAARAQLRADSAQLAFELKRAYVEADLAERNQRTVQQVAAVFRRAERSGAARYGEGDISGYELRRLRVERARYETALRHATVALGSARRHLTALLSPEADGSLFAPATPPAGRPPAVAGSEFLARALSQRGEVEAAALSIEAAIADRSRQRWGALPDPAVTAGYKRQSDGLDGLVIGVEMPVPLLDRRGGESDAAAARLDAAERRHSLVLRQVENEVRTALDDFESLQVTGQLIADTLLAGSEDLLDIAIASYEEGEMSLLELLDAADAYHESQSTRAVVTAELWIAFYDLDRAVGGMPDAGRAGVEER